MESREAFKETASNNYYSPPKAQVSLFVFLRGTVKVWGGWWEEDSSEALKAIFSNATILSDFHLSIHFTLFALRSVHNLHSLLLNFISSQVAAVSTVIQATKERRRRTWDAFRLHFFFFEYILQWPMPCTSAFLLCVRWYFLSLPSPKHLISYESPPTLRVTSQSIRPRLFWSALVTSRGNRRREVNRRFASDYGGETYFINDWI